MPVPPEFQFSQNNLQDYVDCPRRFQLRHLLKQKWPALQSEPVQEQEYRMKQGERFHQMVYQHQLGIEPRALLPNPAEIDLCRWWHNYLEIHLDSLPQQRRPEFTLSAPFAGYRLVAKYDLLAIEPGERFVILDWKTSRKRTPRASLEKRIQTHLYPLLLVLAGMQINLGEPVEPEQVEMIYWFADFPEQPEHIHYTQEQFEEDRIEIYRTVTQITSTMEEVFFMTPIEKNCRFCAYRSLCGRGVQAGNWEDAGEEDSDMDLDSFDFNSIQEIRF